MSAMLDCLRCGAKFEAKRSDARWCPPCKVLQAKDRASAYDTHKRDTCPGCGGSMVRRALLCKACENKSRAEKFAKEGNHRWKEGRYETDGYVYVRTRVGKPGKGKGTFYRAEHILVWESLNGPLPKSWVVHHLNGVRDDNRPENLLGISRKRHSPNQIVEPYEARILELERKLAEKL